jgi:hypothetical protein
MIPSPMQSPGSKRRKVSIEIYFVLYLSAIVLLLGTTTQSKHEDPDALIQTLREFMIDFDVNVEKVALVYTMLPASLEMLPATEQLRRDSVNVVRAWGSVSDVRFEITGIRDTATGQLLPVESATLQNEGPFAAVVKWRPKGRIQNRVYAITVAASADPEVPSTVPVASRARVAEALRSEGRVFDTVTFTVSVFAVTNPNQIHAVVARQQQIPDTPSTPILATVPRPGSIDPAVAGSTFKVIAGQDEVYAVGGKWSAKVIVGGVVNPQTDVIATFEPSNVRIIGWDRDGFVIGGELPKGRQVVRVTATRKSDMSPSGTQITVAAAGLQDPRLPDDLYTGERYDLDFGTNDIDPSQIRVRILENGKVVTEAPYATVEYTPVTTGRVVFERYINGALAGRYNATARALPYPSIGAVRKETDDRATIVTRSYGTISGRENKVSLRIVDGNVRDDAEEIEYRYDKATKTHIQTWRVWRQSEEREFAFTVWAIDLRGSGSATKQRFVVPD